MKRLLVEAAPLLALSAAAYAAARRLSRDAPLPEALDAFEWLGMDRQLSLHIVKFEGIGEEADYARLLDAADSFMRIAKDESRRPSSQAVANRLLSTITHTASRILRSAKADKGLLAAAVYCEKDDLPRIEAILRDHLHNIML